MPQHPERHIRRAVRVLAIVGELHKRGYQRLRVMPFMSPSGAYWRCWIGPVKFFYRNHGAILHEEPEDSRGDEVQERAIIARYTSGQTDQYFGWKDAQMDDIRSLAGKFLKRFRIVADSGHVGTTLTQAGISGCLGSPKPAGSQLFSGTTARCRMIVYPLMTFDRENGMLIGRRRRYCRYPLPGTYSRTTEANGNDLSTPVPKFGVSIGLACQRDQALAWRA